MAVKAGGGGGGKSSAVRAGRAYVELTGDDSGLRTVLTRAKSMVLGFGKMLAKGGGIMAALGGSVLGPILESFRQVVNHFDDIKKASDRLGTSAEVISELGYAAKTAGISFEDLESSLRLNQKAIANNADAFGELGLVAAELEKMPLDERVQAQADALKAVAGDAQKATMAMELFGKSGAKLLPMMKDGGAGIRAAQAEARKVGASISGADAAAAERAGDAISRAWDAAKNTFLAVGASLLPQIDRLERISAVVVDLVGYVRQFINENRMLVASIAAGAAIITGTGLALVAIGGAFAVVSVAIGGFVSMFLMAKAVILSILAAVFSPLGLAIAGVTVAVGAVGYALYQFTTVGLAARNTIAALGQAFQWLKGVAGLAWEGISSALGEGDLPGALAIVLQTLNVLWAGIKVGGTKAWNEVKNVAVDTWHHLVGEGKKALVDIRTELQVFGTDMEEKAKDAFRNIGKYWVNGWKTNIETVWNMLTWLFRTAIEEQKKLGKFVLDSIRNPRTAIAPMIAASPLVLAGIAAAGEVQAGQELAAQEGVKAAQELLREKQKELKAAIDANTEAKKKAGRDARNADLEEKIEELKKQEELLQKMTNEQTAKAAARAMREAIQGAVFGPIDAAADLIRKQQAARGGMAMATSVGGGFGGNMMGYTHSVDTVANKQLDEMKEMNGQLGEIKKRVGGIMAD